MAFLTSFTGGNRDKMKKYIGIFLQAGILGVPVGAALNYTLLLSALAALVLGNFVKLPTIGIDSSPIPLMKSNTAGGAASSGLSLHE